MTHGSLNELSTVVVVIDVSDVNDNNPIFKLAVWDFEAPENTSNPYMGSVFATDDDEDNVLTYSIEYVATVTTFLLSFSYVVIMS